MNYSDEEFYMPQEQDSLVPDFNSDVTAFELGDDDCCQSNVSFGASTAELQLAADLKVMAEWAEGTSYGELCERLADGLSGACVEGMDVLQEKVQDIANFYNIDPVNVFYEEGEPGVQYSGMTSLNYDNWIGGDPQLLSQFCDVYGNDFVTNVIAHETGHQIFDRLGLDDKYPRIANEACADAVAALYAGSRGLDIEGICEFFRQYSGDDINYPDAEERCAIIKEFYEIGKNYEWKMFQDIVDDLRFDLKGTLEEVASRYC